MSLPIAPGHPQYSGTYIGEVWSGKVLEKYYDATILTELTNTDYVGEITGKGADKVKVRTRPDVQVRSYQKGQKLVYDQYQTSIEEMSIDFADYVAFGANQLDKDFSGINFIDDWSKDAAIQLALKIDRFALNLMSSTAHATNQGTTAGRISGGYNLGAAGNAIVLTAANVLTLINAAAATLDENNVPDDNRFLVLPTWACDILANSELRNRDFNDKSSEVRMKGLVTDHNRFKIYRTNLLEGTVPGPTGEYFPMFGRTSATSFALNVGSFETLQNTDDFGSLHRMMAWYGQKTFQPTHLGRLAIKKA